MPFQANYAGTGGAQTQILSCRIWQTCSSFLPHYFKKLLTFSRSMVYHLSHLSLNLPLLDGNNLNKSTSALAITAREICDFSLDVILSIFRRYKYQYSFESVSLIFVQGAILAAETILVMYGTHADRKPLSQSVNLRFLEEVLKDMESMWGIAGSARNELQRRTQGDANKNPALSCELSPIESMGLGNTGQLSDSQDIQPGEQGAFNSICEFIEMDSGIPFMYPELTTRESLTWQDDFAKPFEIEFSGDLGYWPSDLWARGRREWGLYHWTWKIGE